MADCHSIERVATTIGDVLPRCPEIEVSARDVRDLLNQVARVYPETAKAMDAAERMIVRLETLRHEAILPLDLGRTDVARQILKQPALVEVAHG
ncbi:MAG: hypothetical protein EKK46_15095 [Rhodocyclaceae bacterium]|nr:MAG: hypothetical protein EKK46_15095 [Rhodocyclaceae bacterium]